MTDEEYKNQYGLLFDKAVFDQAEVIKEQSSEIERLKKENYHTLYMEYVEKCQGMEFIIDRQKQHIIEMANILDRWAGPPETGGVLLAIAL